MPECPPDGQAFSVLVLCMVYGGGSPWRGVDVTGCDMAAVTGLPVTPHSPPPTQGQRPTGKSNERMKGGGVCDCDGGGGMRESGEGIRCRW